MNKWSSEEYGRFGCLGGDSTGRFLYYQPMQEFFETFWNEKKTFLEQDFSKGKGKINAALSGAQLNGLISTDFFSAMGFVFRRELLEVKADVFIKIEDITLKASYIFEREYPSRGALSNSVSLFVAIIYQQ